MFVKCPDCGTRAPAGWLLFGFPGRKYTCAGCRSRIDGTVTRFVVTSVAVGVLGYTLFAVIRSSMNPASLLVMAVIAFALTFMDLPWQVKIVERTEPPRDAPVEEDHRAHEKRARATEKGFRTPS
jgi:hypothetical protein